MTKTAISKHATTDRISQRVHDSVNHIAKAAGRAEQRTRQKSGEAQLRVREAGMKVRDRSGKTVGSISTFVRENPMTSLGVVVATGAFLYALKRRR